VGTGLEEPAEISVNPQEWRARFTQQSRWTTEARRYLYQRTGLDRAHRILEVGCGPGVILADLRQSTPASVHGLDLRFDFLRLARAEDPETRLTCGDALALPYAGGSFDVCLCHYLLLWLQDPLQGLEEMRRVTRPGGSVVALAEPYYAGRIDYPDELATLGKLQAWALSSQGANPNLGQRLLALFHQAGLRRVHAGLIGGEWGQALDPGFLESEWSMLEHDLHGQLPAQEMALLHRQDEAAWRQGTRILYVPTFYAWGRV